MFVQNLPSAARFAARFLALILLFSSAARADGIEAFSADSATDSTPRKPVLIAPTVITGTREAQRRTESSATIDVVNGEEIRRTRPMHPADIMNRVSGVHVSQLTAEGHSTAIRQPLTTKPMYLYLEDGIPTRATGFFNHNALYEVNVPQSGGIEVLKGPGTALYGSDAIGGIVNILTRAAPARPTLEASFEGGAYGYARVLTGGGFRTPTHGVRVDGNFTQSDGRQDGAKYDRQSGTLRWDYANGTGWSTKTVATVTSVDQHDVPSLPSALFNARSSINLAPIAFRQVRAARISTAIEKDNGATLWSMTPYARHSNLQLLPYWQLSYDPQVWETRNNSIGLLAKVRRNIEQLNARIIAGVDLDYSPGHQFVNQAVVTKVGTPVTYTAYAVGAAQYNYDVTYRSASPYLQLEAAPFKRLHLDAGLRYDAVGYSYETKIAAVDTGAHRVPPSTTVSYRHVSPKFGVTLDVAPALNVYASYRHGFRAPSQGQLFQQNTATNTVGLRPVRANSVEAGIRGTAFDRVGYIVTVYDMVIHDDIITYITASNTRQATNAGETRHRGLESSLGIAVTPDVRVDASYAINSQRYVTWTPSTTQSYGGKRIELAPRTLGNVLVGYTSSLLRGGRLALEWVAVGAYDMDPQNTHRYAGYRLVNLHGTYQVGSTVELFAKGLNLTNRNYAETALYDPFQKELFLPGTPRTVYAGFRLKAAR